VTLIALTKKENKKKNQEKRTDSVKTINEPAGMDLRNTAGKLFSSHCSNAVPIAWRLEFITKDE